MTLHSISGSPPIFKDGKIKPGIYKIQNLRSETYLDIHQYSKQICCRPARDLEDGRGLWEIKSSGVGYTHETQVEPETPEQFCTPMEGLEKGNPLHVTAYSLAWRIEIINDDVHRGFGYVRFFWGPTKKTWDLENGRKENGAKVHIWEHCSSPNQVWKLIPANVEGAPAPSHSSSEGLGSGSLPSYDGDAARQSSTRAQHVEPEYDGFGTIVNEVTVVTTTSTVTTRKRYRVEDA